MFTVSFIFYRPRLGSWKLAKTNVESYKFHTLIPCLSYMNKFL